MISSIDFCHLDDSILIILASSDCSVSLHNIFGVKIGVFGQPDLWKIKPMSLMQIVAPEIKEPEETVNKKVEEVNLIKPAEKENHAFDLSEYTGSSEFGLVKKLNADIKFEDTFTYEKDAFIKNPSLRYNPWSKTILGKLKFLKFHVKKKHGHMYRIHLQISAYPLQWYMH